VSILTTVPQTVGNQAVSRLYARTRPAPHGADLPDALLACYGDFGGGFLIGSSMKLATIDNRDAYGLHRLDELLAQPELAEVRVGVTRTSAPWTAPPVLCVADGGRAAGPVATFNRR